MFTVLRVEFVWYGFSFLPFFIKQVIDVSGLSEVRVDLGPQFTTVTCQRQRGLENRRDRRNDRSKTSPVVIVVVEVRI